VRYVTHSFTHRETLERARRWLIHAGIEPSRIEVRTHRLLRIAIPVSGGEYASVVRMLDAVDLTDPQEGPSFWDLPSHEHHPSAPGAGDESRDQGVTEPALNERKMVHSASHFAVGWHPQD
jgi:hypothetical protein